MLAVTTGRFMYKDIVHVYVYVLLYNVSSTTIVIDRRVHTCICM